MRWVYGDGDVVVGDRVDEFPIWDWRGVVDGYREEV
jgi:hypothetical protein